MRSMIFQWARILLALEFLVGVASPLVHADIISPSGPLLTVREVATASLGEGTKPQVYEKAKREALRKAIELAGGLQITVESTMRACTLLARPAGRVSSLPFGPGNAR